MFTDPAPDRWGQTLLRRNERMRARAEKRAPRSLFAVDFLTLMATAFDHDDLAMAKTT